MLTTNLVLEGGGVKGIGLAGAVAGVMEEYDVHRVAGTSAGAIVAAFVASGLGGRLEEIMIDTGGRRIERELADAGVRTWGDLRIDWNPRTPVAQRYGLVVLLSDVNRGRTLRLPWDFEALLGVDPDRMPVADAVLASASIPGMLSSCPTDLFDDDPVRPTVSVKLSARLGPAHDQVYIDEPSVASRTIFVDTHEVRSTDLGIDRDTRALLFDNGLRAAANFLVDWDYDEWRREYAGALGQSLA